MATGRLAWGRRIVVAGALAAGVAGVAGVTADEGSPNARLKDPGQRFAVTQAIRGAHRRLEAPRCQGLLDEFADASGRSLSAVLRAQGTSVSEHLDLVFFYDAPASVCEDVLLAGVRSVGSRVVQVCGRRFARAWSGNARHAEAVVIHETFHSLGLGENPPSSHHITSRILAECRD